METYVKLFYKIGEFAGKPFLSINEKIEKNGVETEKEIIKFGLKKAKAIIASLSEIEKFIKDNSK